MTYSDELKRRKMLLLEEQLDMEEEVESEMNEDIQKEFEETIKAHLKDKDYKGRYMPKKHREAYTKNYFISITEKHEQLAAEKLKKRKHHIKDQMDKIRVDKLNSELMGDEDEYEYEEEHEEPKIPLLIKIWIFGSIGVYGLISPFIS